MFRVQGSEVSTVENCRLYGSRSGIPGIAHGMKRLKRNDEDRIL
jgi:hypothetical protein